MDVRTLVLEALHTALDDAGIAPNEVQGFVSETGVIPTPCALNLSWRALASNGPSPGARRMETPVSGIHRCSHMQPSRADGRTLSLSISVLTGAPRRTVSTVFMTPIPQSWDLQSSARGTPARSPCTSWVHPGGGAIMGDDAFTQSSDLSVLPGYRPRAGFSKFRDDRLAWRRR